MPAGLGKAIQDHECPLPAEQDQVIRPIRPGQLSAECTLFVVSVRLHIGHAPGRPEMIHATPILAKKRHLCAVVDSLN